MKVQTEVAVVDKVFSSRTEALNSLMAFYPDQILPVHKVLVEGGEVYLTRYEKPVALITGVEYSVIDNKENPKEVSRDVQ